MVAVEGVHDTLVGELVQADAVVGADGIQLELGAQLIAVLFELWRNGRNCGRGSASQQQLMTILGG